MTINSTNRLTALWQEHCALRFPAGLGGEEIQGIDLALLDADIAGCIDSYIKTEDLDQERKKFLSTCLLELDKVIPELKGHAQEYFSRLREMTLIILKNVRQI